MHGSSECKEILLRRSETTSKTMSTDAKLATTISGALLYYMTTTAVFSRRYTYIYTVYTAWV